MRGVLAQKFFNRIHVFGGRPAPLIFPEDHIFQCSQIVQERTLIVRPFGFVGVFRLETPDAAELRHPDFAFSTFRILLLPYVLTPHPAGILH